MTNTMSKFQTLKYSYIFFLILIPLASINGCTTVSTSPLGPNTVASNNSINDMRLVPTDPPLNVVPSYTGSKQGHWITEILSHGKFVLLEDDSVWEVKLIDADITNQWQKNEKIIIIINEYKGYTFNHLFNVDANNEVSAAYLGQAVLRTQISGHFGGWNGDTAFALANGNILKQMTYQYTYHDAYYPEAIVISYGGAYFLLVDGVNETVGVMVVR